MVRKHFHFENAFVQRKCGAPQSDVDSVKDDIFWQNANFNVCKKPKFICSKKELLFQAVVFWRSAKRPKRV